MWRFGQIIDKMVPIITVRVAVLLYTTVYGVHWYKYNVDDT